MTAEPTSISGFLSAPSQSFIFAGLLFPKGVSEDDSRPFLSPLQPDVSVLLPLDDPAMQQPLSANMGVSVRGLEIFY